MPFTRDGYLTFRQLGPEFEHRQAMVFDEEHVGHFEPRQLGREQAVEVLEEQRQDGGTGRAAHVGWPGEGAIVFRHRFRQRRVDHRAGLGAFLSQRHRVVALDEGDDRPPFGRARGFGAFEQPIVARVIAGCADVAVFVGIGLREVRFGLQVGGGSRRYGDARRGMGDTRARSSARVGAECDQHGREQRERRSHLANPFDTGAISHTTPDSSKRSIDQTYYSSMPSSRSRIRQAPPARRSAISRMRSSLSL